MDTKRPVIQASDSATIAETFAVMHNATQPGSAARDRVMQKIHDATREELIVPGRVALRDGYIRLFEDGSLWDEETGATYTSAQGLPAGIVQWEDQ